MLLGEILRLAFSSLAANKLRSALTMLGITVGVFSVIGVMTAITGMRVSIEEGLNRLGANSVQISKYPAINFGGQYRRYANRRNIDYATAVRFKEKMGDDVRVNLLMMRGGRRASYLDRRTNPNIRLYGSDENYLTAFNYDIAAGRNLSPDDVTFGRPVCLLGADVVQRLFPNEEALGHVVRVEGNSYTVVGRLAAKGTSFGQNQDGLIVVPITRWLRIYGQYWYSIGLNVQGGPHTDMVAMQERIIGTMRLLRGLKPEDPNDFEMYSNDSLVAAFDKIAHMVAVGAFVISAIALLASGVGVMNIMLVSVTERTREIGIRKSIGAKKHNILTQFLLEATALSLVGGAAGVLIGIIGGNVVALLLHAEMVFPWLWAGIGVLVCSGIGIGFGLYPAWKAASLDPIEALRYE